MINSKLLVHSAAIYTVTKDMDGNDAESVATNLGRVRIVYNDGQADGSNGKTPASAATLYFDTTLSTPAGFVPLKNMRLVFNNKTFTVADVKPAYGKKGDPDFYKAALNG